MTDELKLGDEVWVMARIDNPNPSSDGDIWVSVPYGLIGEERQGFYVQPTAIRKSVISEQLQTAELERKVVDAAFSLVANWDQTKTVLTHLPAMDLRDAVCKLEKTLAPPSLEDEIAGLLRDRPTLGPEAMAEDIVDLVARHSSSLADNPKDT